MDSRSCRAHRQNLQELAPAQWIYSCQEISGILQLQGTLAVLQRLPPGPWVLSCLESEGLRSCSGADTADVARSLPYMAALNGFACASKSHRRTVVHVSSSLMGPLKESEWKRRPGFQSLAQPDASKCSPLCSFLAVQAPS